MRAMGARRPGQGRVSGERSERNLDAVEHADTMSCAERALGSARSADAGMIRSSAPSAEYSRHEASSRLRNLHGWLASRHSAKCVCRRAVICVLSADALLYSAPPRPLWMRLSKSVISVLSADALLYSVTSAASVDAFVEDLWSPCSPRMFLLYSVFSASSVDAFLPKAASITSGPQPTSRTASR